MSSKITDLAQLLDGWNGYQSSLVNAITPLTSQQLLWKPAASSRCIGETARHISLGRITWFSRMSAPGSAGVTAQITQWATDRDGNRDVVEDALPITDSASELVKWLELTWGMIEQTLNTWNVSDLSEAYLHTWNGQTYRVSRQWTLWRILSHDLHHGGELSLLLGLQGIEAFELSDLFGHIILPPLAD